MRGVILAAGRGSRMGRLTDDGPKCLVELAGRPLFDWQVSSLRAAGVTNLGAVVGWQGQRLHNRGIDLVENPRWADTNMVASLACASTWLESERCIVSYSDIFYHPEAVEGLIASPGDIAIAFDPCWLELWSQRFADVLSDAESFRLDAGGRVTEIGGRAATIDEIRGQYMGLLKITPTGWREIREVLTQLDDSTRDRLDMTSLLGRLIRAGIPIRATAIHSSWGEVDSASDLALYERMLREGRMRLPIGSEPLDAARQERGRDSR